MSDPRHLLEPATLFMDQAPAARVDALAKLIAESRPDIVQGWMYYGDLATLVALVLSGRRRQTRLV
jgi:hypothetical protein